MILSSLRTRIILGTLLLSLIISVILSLAVVLTFETAERIFFEAHYQTDIDTFITQHVLDPDVLELSRKIFKEPLN